MSSETAIHLWSKPIKGRVDPLAGLFCATVALVIDDPGGEPGNRERFTLFIKDDRLLETSLLFHKIAQDLAALLPGVDACCRCVPGTPDDQCAEHGFGAYKIRAAAGCDCTAPPPQPCSPYCKYPYMDGDTIPIDDAREAVEPPHRWG